MSSPTLHLLRRGRPVHANAALALFSFALVAGLFGLGGAGDAFAQDLDDLDDLDEGVVLEEVFEPGIEPSTWELSLTFGQMDVSQELLAATGIVVDIEEPGEFITSDMALSGEQSFAPALTIGRTFGRNFALQGTAMFAVGDFEQSLTGNQRKYVDPLSENEVTELETEKGSYWQWNTSLEALWYPRGEGRIQPYLIGGVGYQFLELDSIFVANNVSAPLYSYGIGLRIVGDDLYSFRIEVRNYHSTQSFDPADEFATIVAPNGGGVFDIPVFQEDPNSDGTVEVLIQRDRQNLSVSVVDPELAAVLQNLGVNISEYVSDELAASLLATLPNGGSTTQNLVAPSFTTDVSYDDFSYSQLHVTVGFVAAF